MNGNSDAFASNVHQAFAGVPPTMNSSFPYHPKVSRNRSSTLGEGRTKIPAKPTTNKRPTCGTEVESATNRKGYELVKKNQKEQTWEDLVGGLEAARKTSSPNGRKNNLPSKRKRGSADSLGTQVKHAQQRPLLTLL